MIWFAACVTLPGCAGRSDVGAGYVDIPAVTAIVAVGDIPVVTVRPGESSDVAIPIVVAPGYHVQSNPAGNEFLVPLELHLDDAAGVRFGRADYPAASPYRLEGTDEDLMTYHGSVFVKLRVTALASASVGEEKITGSLRYQACDPRRCLFPSSVPVAFRIVVREP